MLNFTAAVQVLQILIQTNVWDPWMGDQCIFTQKDAHYFHASRTQTRDLSVESTNETSVIMERNYKIFISILLCGYGQIYLPLQENE